MFIYLFTKIRSFNPRTHEECDHFKPPFLAEYKVSIHALTRSATFPFSSFRLFLWCFNPRTHEECDLR